MTKKLNQPTSGNEMPRFAGIASMFRLPVVKDSSDLDVAIIGVPLDIGTSNRTGARYGPRQIRTESVLIRPYGMATGADMKRGNGEYPCRGRQQCSEACACFTSAWFSTLRQSRGKTDQKRYPASHQSDVACNEVGEHTCPWRTHNA